MSALRISAGFRRAPLISSSFARARFSLSAAAPYAGKESSLHDHGRAEEIEKYKQDQLAKKETGSQHWEEGLASDSESAVKADRAETSQSTQEQIKKLQEEGTKVGQGQGQGR